MKKLILVLLLVCQHLIAQSNITLDWDVNTWGGSLLTNSYNIDANNSGNDVSIGITGYTSKIDLIQTDSFNTGGLIPSQQGLRLRQDLDRRNEYNIITINFNYVGGITDLYFSIFDIDKNNDEFIDKVTINGYSNGIAMMPTIIGSPDNNVSGNVVWGNDLVSQTSSNGNAYISFGSTYVDSVTIMYNNYNGVQRDPAIQSITLADLHYTVPTVPEPEFYGLITFGLLGMVVLLQHIKNLPQNEK